MTEVLKYRCVDCDDRNCFVEFVDRDVMTCPIGLSSFWYFVEKNVI